jgi:4-hydroxy-3-methylbut-2-enyl diphosphate reductase
MLVKACSEPFQGESIALHVEKMRRALEKYGTPFYVRHEIVHNAYVIESLKAKGVCFVKV